MADNSALLTTAIITGIIALATMIFKSIKKSECIKTQSGVCCDCDNSPERRRSNSTLEINNKVIENKHPIIISTEI